VTGIGSNGSNYVYCIGQGYSAPCVERFTSTGSHYTYTSSIAGLVGPHDCAYEGGSDGTGDIWVANDNATSPIRVYNSAGNMVGGIPATIVPDACGMAFESLQYLWVSDPTADLIYKVDLTTGIEGGEGIPVERALNVSSNPFYGSLVVTVTGFTDASLDIFDVCGRRVLGCSIRESHTWDGCGPDGTQVPAGAYLIRVSDSTGYAMTRSVVKL
jgi:hypothetical protein